MARIRSIHPVLWTNEAFASSSDTDRLLLIKAWSLSEGCGLYAGPGDFTNLRRAGLVQFVGEGLVLCRNLGRPDLAMAGRAAVDRHLLFWRKVKQAKTWAERGTGVTFKAWRELRAAVLKRDNRTCRYCGANKGFIECDHVVAISRGGRTEMANLVAACRPCNRAKGAKSLAEWVG